jgi:nicotinamidase-related amidase
MKLTKTIRIRPRYLRLYTDAGIELMEKNYNFKELDWQIPLDQIALICLDCWNHHFSYDTLERIEKIIHNNIVPLLKACREKNVTIIHSPADPVATRHPNWIRLKPKEAKPCPPWPDSPVWPPDEFKNRLGIYAQYARPTEPQEAERIKHCQAKRDFHKDIKPFDNEPVVLDGEELHRLCAVQGILHLFYIGFSTNACIMRRDSGVSAMALRGYHTILVRDCTTGMETFETREDLVCTRGAIASIEQFDGYSITSTQIRKALSNNSM